MDDFDKYSVQIDSDCVSDDFDSYDLYGERMVETESNNGEDLELE